VKRVNVVELYSNGIVGDLIVARDSRVEDIGILALDGGNAVCDTHRHRPGHEVANAVEPHASIFRIDLIAGEGMRNRIGGREYLLCSAKPIAVGKLELALVGGTLSPSGDGRGEQQKRQNEQSVQSHTSCKGGFFIIDGCLIGCQAQFFTKLSQNIIMVTNITKLAVISAALLLMYSCNNDGTSTTEQKMDTAGQDVKEAATNAVAEVKEAFTKNDDSDFVVNATQHNYTEIKLLEAGIAKGTDKEVKANAKAMLAEHKQLGNKIKSIADAKHYPLPADDEGKAKDRMESLDKNAKGKDWDKAWTDDVEDVHGKMIDDFETVSKNTKDSELKTWADATLPKLREHKDKADKLKDRLSK
jgi:putative membrane protein